MKINIEYNDNIDIFSKDVTFEQRLKKYVLDKCPLANAFSNYVPVFLLGGAIRDLMYAKEPKDLDFMILDSRFEDLIPKALERLNIEYKFNRFGGYKFVSNGIEVDLWANDDMFSAIEYNVDGLFFDLGKNELVSLTFDDFIKNGLIKVNDNNNIDVERVEKLKQFEKKFRNNL